MYIVFTGMSSMNVILMMTISVIKTVNLLSPFPGGSPSCCGSCFCSCAPTPASALVLALAPAIAPPDRTPPN